MKSISSLFLCCFCMACAPLKKIADLPMLLKENSGMLYSDSSIWLHNDSGDNPYLYKLRMDGSLIRTLQIVSAQNIDWEDITQDKKGNVYIGDFGNNYNQRQDLCIYKIPNPESLTADTVTAQRINFHYPDQTAFPPPPSYRHFDVEAMVAWEDSLYLFTKNRTQPNNGWVKIYRLSNQAGDYVANLVDSLEITPHSFLQSITGAAISPDGKKLALLSMFKIHLFSNFEGSRFFQAKQLKQLKLPFTQKEAIDFLDNRTLLISDEKSPFGKAHLYRLRLP